MDWGEFYTFLLAHTSMSVDDISNRSLPFLLAVRDNLTPHICIKAGMPYNGSDSTTDSTEHNTNINIPQQTQGVVNAHREATLEDMEMVLGGFGRV